MRSDFRSMFAHTIGKPFEKTRSTARRTFQFWSKHRKIQPTQFFETVNRNSDDNYLTDAVCLGNAAAFDIGWSQNFPYHLPFFNLQQ
jgi:hypothetical protein